jgi:hypothetical protein
MQRLRLLRRHPLTLSTLSPRRQTQHCIRIKSTVTQIMLDGLQMRLCTSLQPMSTLQYNIMGTSMQRTSRLQSLLLLQSLPTHTTHIRR